MVFFHMPIGTIALGHKWNRKNLPVFLDINVVGGHYCSRSWGRFSRFTSQNILHVCLTVGMARTFFLILQSHGSYELCLLSSAESFFGTTLPMVLIKTAGGNKENWLNHTYLWIVILSSLNAFSVDTSLKKLLQFCFVTRDNN